MWYTSERYRKFTNKGIVVNILLKKIVIDDVTQWIERPGLVEYLPHMMMNIDMAVTQAKEILQNVLQ